MKEHKLHIALVDDDEDDRSFFEEAIEEINIATQLFLFENGQEILKFLNLNQPILPKLIFLDLNMPIINGLQCLKEIRSHNHLDLIKVAIYSTSSSSTDIESAFAEGANLYVTKPDSFKKLTEIIHNILRIDWSKSDKELTRDNFIYS
ncbi:response regulator [Maribacter sp. MAR_2009_72]|uniref:response regulator n=1 Tax=Maribacter sp. MAR_2009_72 TaxID=1250050 RepID=UPI0011990570|nr:response regulator [Maribacter sp. MAR_2009_72]TVZ15454.1 response regulator receiver domain-containing protein [Maribacter sp. MAR_2009_72]